MEFLNGLLPTLAFKIGRHFLYLEVLGLLVPEVFECLFDDRLFLQNFIVLAVENAVDVRRALVAAVILHNG